MTRVFGSELGLKVEHVIFMHITSTVKEPGKGFSGFDRPWLLLLLRRLRVEVSSSKTQVGGHLGVAFLRRWRVKRGEC